MTDSNTTEDLYRHDVIQAIARASTALRNAARMELASRLHHIQAAFERHDDDTANTQWQAVWQEMLSMTSKAGRLDTESETALYFVGATLETHRACQQTGVSQERVDPSGSDFERLRDTIARGNETQDRYQNARNNPRTGGKRFFLFVVSSAVVILGVGLLWVAFHFNNTPWIPGVLGVLSFVGGAGGIVKCLWAKVDTINADFDDLLNGL